MLFVCHPKILHKQCFQFLLGVKMAPREAENNVMQNVGGDKQRALWYVMVLNCSGQLKNAFALVCRRLLFSSLHRNFLSSLKLKNFNFFGKRWIFVRTERKFEEIPLLENLLISPNPSLKITFNHSVESENDWIYHVSKNRELSSHVWRDESRLEKSKIGLYFI